MATITIKQTQTQSSVVFAVFGIFLLISLLSVIPLASSTPKDFVLPAVFAGIIILAAWSLSVQRQRSVEIDTAKGLIVVKGVTVLFRPKCTTYKLSQFGSIVSYITRSRFPKNRVELVETTGGTALLLATFTPDSSAKSFFSIPVEIEAQEAGHLRASIAQACHVKDRGFIGSRFIGHQV